MIQKTDIKRILLLDDDEDECMLFKEAFDSLHLQKEFLCQNDSSKLEVTLLEKKPDIIFLDINMPRRNGFECLEVVRNQMKLSLPIIMYSNSFRSIEVFEAYEKGANLFVRKPSSFSKVKSAINEILEKNWKELEKLFEEYYRKKKVLVMD